MPSAPSKRLLLVIAPVLVIAALFSMHRIRRHAAAADHRLDSAVPVTDGTANSAAGSTTMVASRRDRPAASGLTRSRLKTILAEDDLLARSRELSELFSDLTSTEDFERTIADLRGLKLEDASDEMQLLVSAWCRLDIRRAADFSVKSGVPELIWVAAKDWGARDPDEALAWAQGLQEGPYRNAYILTRVLLAMASSEPERALAAAGSMNAGEGRFTAQVTAEIMRLHPGAMAGFIESLPTAAARDQSMLGMISVICQDRVTSWTDSFVSGSYVTRLQPVPDLTASDRKAAVTWVATHPEVAGAAAMNPALFRKYAADDPGAARTLASDLPAGPTRDAALSGVALELAVKDSLTAGKRMLTECSVEAREGLWSAWASEQAQTNPEKFLADAALIDSEALRKRWLPVAFRAWRASDPQAAEAWIGQHREYSELTRDPH